MEMPETTVDIEAAALPDTDEAAAIAVECELAAYRLGAPTDDEDLWPAPVKRVWMERSPNKFANRCLPLLIANQSGWLLINTETVRLTWNGGQDLDDIEIRYDGDAPPMPALSHFGMGIVTWNVPYFFRTSPGWNLLVRGPANCPKDGIYALDAVVESDWTTSTFTMNWQLTRPGLDVVFDRGEPLCMLVPQRRHDLERIGPVLRSFDDDDELGRRVQAWTSSRGGFLADLEVDHSAGRARRWQKHYFQGRDIDGRRNEVHQTKLQIRPFADETSGSETVADET